MFYTYEIYNTNTGYVLKVGKGSGNRAQVSLNEVASAIQGTIHADHLPYLAVRIIQNNIILESDAFEAETIRKNQLGSDTLLFE